MAPDLRGTQTLAPTAADILYAYNGDDPLLIEQRVDAGASTTLYGSYSSGGVFSKGYDANGSLTTKSVTSPTGTVTFLIIAMVVLSTRPSPTGRSGSKDCTKTSSLFIDLLKKLLVAYADEEVIHVVLDNYTIHSSKQTKLWLAEHGQKFKLHFLPPYCPDDNRIERKLCREMHANVTVNHRCPTIDKLNGSGRVPPDEP